MNVFRLIFVSYWLSLIALSAQPFTLRDPAFLGSLTPASTAAAFSPSDVSGMVFWFNDTSGAYTDYGSTAAANGQAVQQWNDLSGNAYHFYAPAAGKLPIYVASLLNGKPGLAFDSADDCMTNVFGSAQTPPNTYFIVHCLTNVATSSRTIFDGINSSARNVFQYNNANPPDSLQFAGTTSIYFGPTPTNAWMLTVINLNGTSSYLRTNCVPAATASGTPGSQAPTGLTLNARYALDSPGGMYVSEFIMYNANVSAVNVTNVENYLKAKWGLP